MTVEVPSSFASAEELWTRLFESLCERMGPCFARSETRERAKAYLRGLLSPIERKNGWQLAEEAGWPTPYAMQYLLNRAVWESDEVRDQLQGYVREMMADAQGMLVIDETGFLKKGKKSVGVQRQDSGTAGRIENCQIGVFLTYASKAGHTLVDREAQELDARPRALSGSRCPSRGCLCDETRTSCTYAVAHFGCWTGSPVGDG
jgi:SRSO17 transposase